MSRQANHPPENDGDKTTCTRNRSSTINRQERLAMNENKLLERITANPAIFRGKSIIRGRRLAVEHVLGMLAAGDDFETLLEGYPWLEQEDILACLAYAHRLVEHERIEPLIVNEKNCILQSRTARLQDRLAMP